MPIDATHSRIPSARFATPLPMGGVLLAASPVFGGPATRPYRVILWRQPSTGELVVHTQQVAIVEGEIAGGGCTSGDYFSPPDAEKAVVRWHERVQREIDRGRQCLILF